MKTRILYLSTAIAVIRLYGSGPNAVAGISTSVNPALGP
jgi:hypothetical protein